MKSELLTALQSVSQADLDEVNAEIETHNAAIDRLKGLKQVIEIQLGVRKPQGGTSPGHEAEQAESHARGARINTSYTITSGKA